MPVSAQATDRGAKGSLTDAWPRTHKRGHMQLPGDSLMLVGLVGASLCSVPRERR